MPPAPEFPEKFENGAWRCRTSAQRTANTGYVYLLLSEGRLFRIDGSGITARSTFTLMRSATGGPDLPFLQALRLLHVLLFHLLGLLLVPLLHLLLPRLRIILL